MITVKDEDGKERKSYSFRDMQVLLATALSLLTLWMIVTLLLTIDSLGDMGEFNVMVADKKDRRKGYGYYSVLLVMMWCMHYSRLAIRRQSLLEVEGVLCQDQQEQHSLHKDV